MNPLTLTAITLAVIGFSGEIMAQAPANDHFASAQSLAGASPSATGDNSGATLEAGEINPGGQGGASVWFVWTAPTSGWHTVHTSSEDPARGLDTVVALFSGGTLVTDTTMLGHNDESIHNPQDYPVSVYPDGKGPSRLVFQATAGTIYRIAVHGYHGATGQFEIHIAPEAVPEFIVSSVTFDPATVDITAGEATTTASLAILAQYPFFYASVSVRRANNGSAVSENPIFGGDQTSGTATDGTYETTFTVPMFESPGLFPVRVGQYSHLLDHLISWSPQGNDMLEDNYLIPQTPAWLDVENEGDIDTTAPELSSLTLTPSSFDLSTGDAELELVLDFTDDLSGLQLVEVWISNNDFGTSLARFELPWDELTSGNANAGRITIPCSMDAGSIPPGTYDIRVSLSDVTNNTRHYGASGDPLPSGSTTTFVNTATPPANDNFAGRATLGPALPATATSTNIYATMESGESDLNHAAAGSVWYQWTAPASGWVRLTVGTTGYNHPIFAVFTGSGFPSLDEVGRSDNVAASGAASGPMVFHATADVTYSIAVYGLSYGDFTTSGNFTLTLESIPPPAARVTGFNLTPTSVDVASGPQPVTLEIDLETDVAFGSPSSLSAYLTPVSGILGSNTVSVVIPHTARSSGTDTDGTYEATLNLPGWYEPSLWNLVVEIYHQSTSTRWSPAGSNIVGDKFLIPQSGGQVSLTNSGFIDTAPPVLVSLSGLPTFADVSSPVPVTLDLTITDDASGLASGYIYLTTSTEFGSSTTGVAVFGPAQRVSGDATNGTYQVSFNLTNFLVPGDYTVEVWLYDLSGKLARYGGYLGPTFPSGSSTSITISHGPAGGYLAWAATQDFGPSGLDGLLDDANRDGTKNLLCYAFHIAPFSTFASPLAAGGTSGLPLTTVVGEGANRRLRIEYLQRRGSSGLTYLPQFCSNPASVGPDGWQTASIPAPVVIDADWERVIVEDSVTGASTRFGRVVVEYTDP